MEANMRGKVLYSELKHNLERKVQGCLYHRGKKRYRKVENGPLETERDEGKS
jgi:hypothetical protein